MIYFVFEDRVPEQPSAQWPLSTVPSIEIFRDGAWTAFENALASDKSELRRLELAPVETAGEASVAASSQLEVAQKTLAQRELIAGELLEELEREQLQQAATETRLAALREDRRRNKDAQKLKIFGSESGWSVIEHVCPTCQQHLADTLLPQGPIENPMSVEENITFIENQIGTFEHLSENAALLIARKEAELSTFRSEIESLRAQIRSLRQTLLAPTSTPAIEAVRIRISIETRIRTAEQVIADFSETMESFAEVAIAWRGVLEKKRSLPADGFSRSDKTKLAQLQTLFRACLKSGKGSR